MALCGPTTQNYGMAIVAIVAIPVPTPMILVTAKAPPQTRPIHYFPHSVLYTGQWSCDLRFLYMQQNETFPRKRLVWSLYIVR